jgi:LEA14-like dessication related protein
MKNNFIAIIIGLFLFSCKSFKEAECTGVKGFKVNSVNTSGIDADVVLGIKNPNTIGFSIYPSEFDVVLSGIQLGKAKMKKRVHIAANDEREYSFNLKSSFKDMNVADVMKLMSSQSFVTILVKGDLKAGKFYLKKKFPVNVKQSLR